MAQVIYKHNFNPRSLTGATHTAKVSPASESISIHAPLRERLVFAQHLKATAIFQSTLPYGSDLLVGHSYYFVAIISIHAPLRERLSTSLSALVKGTISIHAPLRERRLKNSILSRCLIFQSTLPRGSDVLVKS